MKCLIQECSDNPLSTIHTLSCTIGIGYTKNRGVNIVEMLKQMEIFLYC